jgi:hypothetical protein
MSGASKSSKSRSFTGLSGADTAANKKQRKLVQEDDVYEDSSSSSTTSSIGDNDILHLIPNFPIVQLMKGKGFVKEGQKTLAHFSVLGRVERNWLGNVNLF